jgi:hypothetical protein
MSWIIGGFGEIASELRLSFYSCIFASIGGFPERLRKGGFRTPKIDMVASALQNLPIGLRDS